MSQSVLEWGTELWDRHEAICSIVQDGIEFIETNVIAVLKERSKIESDYAFKLRALVKKFTLSDTKKEKKHRRNTLEQFSHERAYKKILEEIGFEAGQHEVYAEILGKSCCKNTQDIVKDLKDRKKSNIKQYVKLEERLKQSQKTMEASREAFRKAYDDYVKSDEAYARAQKDCNIPRLDIVNLRQQYQTKNKISERIKGEFASSIVESNKVRYTVYSQSLPQVINDLQQMQIDKTKTISSTMLSMVEAREKVAPIINSCYQTIAKIINEEINMDADSNLIVDRLKTGNVPPDDIPLHDMSTPNELLAYCKIDLTSLLTPSFHRQGKALSKCIYPRKREIERRIEDKQSELVKNEKDLKALQKIADTYAGTPKFGDKKNIEAEIKLAMLRIQEINSDLRLLEQDHIHVEAELDQLKRRNSNCQIYNRSCSSQSASISSHGGSSSITDDDMGDMMKIEDGRMSEDENCDNIYEHLPAQSESSRNCIALYSFQGDMEENSLSMEQDEEFQLLEEDTDGWTKVRRLTAECTEGYVPTSYVQYVQ